MMFFYESFSSTLSYTSQTYAEAMGMCPDVPYTPYATYPRGVNSDIITFTHFEEGGLLSETCDNMESGNRSGYYSTLPPLIGEE